LYITFPKPTSRTNLRGLAGTAERYIGHVDAEVFVTERVGLDGCGDGVGESVVDRDVIASDVRLESPHKQIGKLLGQVRTHGFDELINLSRRDTPESRGLEQFVLCHFDRFDDLAAGDTRSRFRWRQCIGHWGHPPKTKTKL
jgi:hypothetical protein